jgi:CheY-like chemotaxis protein
MAGIAFEETRDSWHTFLRGTSRTGAHGGSMAARHPATILVIDDEPSITRGLAQLLRRDGYTVETADSGQHALAQLHAHPYDVIVSDLQMPELDGRAFYTLLQQQYTALRRRVIFLTGNSDEPDNQAFLTQCGQPWLRKPCPIAVLRRTIQQVLAERTSHARSLQLSRQSQTLRTRSQRLLGTVQTLAAQSAQWRTAAARLRASYRSQAGHARQIAL